MMYLTSIWEPLDPVTFRWMTTVTNWNVNKRVLLVAHQEQNTPCHRQRTSGLIFGSSSGGYKPLLSVWKSKSERVKRKERKCTSIIDTSFRQRVSINTALYPHTKFSDGVAHSSIVPDLSSHPLPLCFQMGIISDSVKYRDGGFMFNLKFVGAFLTIHFSNTTLMLALCLII